MFTAASESMVMSKLNDKDSFLLELFIIPSKEKVKSETNYLFILFTIKYHGSVFHKTFHLNLKQRSAPKCIIGKF